MRLPVGEFPKPAAANLLLLLFSVCYFGFRYSHLGIGIGMEFSVFIDLGYIRYYGVKGKGMVVEELG